MNNHSPERTERKVDSERFDVLVRTVVLKEDLDSQIIFLLTFSQYAHPEELFSAVQNLYPIVAVDSGKLAKLNAFLHLWMTKVDDIDRNMVQRLLGLEQLHNSSETPRERRRSRVLSLSSPGNRIHKSTSHSQLDSYWSPESPRFLNSSSPRSKNSPRPLDMKMTVDVRYSLSFSHFLDFSKVDFLKFSTTNLAKQMTLLDQELTCKVKMSELRDKILRPEGKYASITAMSDRFNQVSYWIATQIVVAPSTKVRVELIEKFIDIGAKLLKYYNFKGVYSVIAGLNNVNILRLRSVWKCVSQKSMNILRKLEETMSHTGNYSRYRALMRQCLEKQTPAVPLICLLLQDLTFVNDGNVDLHSDGQVNLEKWVLFGGCMLNFSKLLENKYTFTRNHNIRRVLQDDLLVLPETLIMKHSYAIEARRRTPCSM